MIQATYADRGSGLANLLRNAYLLLGSSVTFNLELGKSWSNIGFVVTLCQCFREVNIVAA
jgi:hypothetical protein